MTGPGQNLLIRVAVQDAASIPVAKINEGFAATGVAATQASIRTTTALAQTDAALMGTSARVAALGEANTASAAAAAGAWTRTSTAIAAGGSAAVATGSKVAKATELMKPLLGMVALFGAAHFLGGALDAGKDDLLGIRLVKQEFGAASKEVLEFSDNAAQAFGMSAAGSNKMVAMFGQYLTALGLANSKDLPELSMKLTEVTANVAKFNGVSNEDASQAIQMGLRGRGAALNKYGITVNAASIAQAAFNHHLSETGLTAAEQAGMAKYYAIVDASAKQMGSLDKAQGSLALSQAQVAASAENLQAKIGQGMVPVLAAASSLLNTAVIPGFSALFDVVGPVFKLFSILPAPIQSGIAAWLVLIALRTPISFFFRMIQMNAAAAAVALGAGGIAGAAGTAIGGLSKFAGFMAGPWGLAIGAGVIALTAFMGRSSEATVATADFSQAIDENTGALSLNAPAIVAKALADDKALEKAKLAGANITTFTSAVLGNTAATQSAKEQIAAHTVEMIKNSDANKENSANFGLFEKGAKDAGLSLTDYAVKILDGADAQKQLAAVGLYWEDGANNQITAIQTLGSESDKLKTQQQEQKDAITAARAEMEKSTDATLGHADAQDVDRRKSAELKVWADNLTVNTFPPLIAKINTLKLGWASMDDQVNTVITNLDRLAGRDAPVEQAIGNMYKALRDQASQFNLGQQGAKRLDPSKLYNPDGTINQRSDAGTKLYSTLTADQQSIVTAGTAEFDQTFAKTKDLTKAREAANKVVSEGYALEEKNLTSLLGSKKAADDLMKTYGHLPSTVVSTIIANTNQADTALTALGSKVAAVTGAPNPAATPGAGGGTAQGTVNFTAPFDQSQFRNSADAARGGGGGGGGAAASSFTAPFDQSQYRNSADAAARAYTGGGGGTFGGGGGGTFGGGMGRSATISMPRSAMPSTGLWAGTKWPSTVERWRPTALTSLSIMGEPASEIDTVLYRINKESTGDPTATNNWDINAKNGTPSKGLVQVIDPTFKSYALPGHNNIWNPLDNLLAGENYSKHHYGSVVAGFSRAGGYDNGGWLPPGGIAVSNLPTPEPVLSTSQWNVAKAAMNHVVEKTSIGSTGANINVQITVHGRMDGDAKEELRAEIAQIFKEEHERSM